MFEVDRVSTGKDNQIEELRAFTEQFVEGSRRGVMISVKGNELSVSLLGVSSLECYAMLREGLQMTVASLEAALGISEDKEMH